MIGYTPMLRAGAGNISLIDALPDTTNLQLCVDVGDSASLASSAANTSLLDLSPQGNDMEAGRLASADAEDPVFSGTIGDQSDAEYVFFDGVIDTTFSDQYRFATVPAWLDSFHQDGAAFAILFCIYFEATTGIFICGNSVTSPIRAGFRVFVDHTPSNFNLEINDTSNPPALLASTNDLEIPVNSWMFCCVTLDETAGTGRFFINGQTETFTSTYTSPNAGAAPNLFAFGNNDYQHGASSPSQDTRFACAAMYEGRELTLQEILFIYENLFDRFNFGS